jgi:hypothetical protein
MVYDECECNAWIRSYQKFFTNHHSLCEFYDSEGDASLILTKLLEELEFWINGHKITPPEHIKEVLYMASLLSRYDLHGNLRPKRHQKSEEGV